MAAPSPIIRFLTARVPVLLRPLKKYYLLYLALGLSVGLYFVAREHRPHVRFEAELKATKTDVFQFFYQPVEEQWFGQNYSKKWLVHGSNNYQTFSFDIPPEVNFKALRLDIGDNRQQEYVDIKTIRLLYGKDTMLLFNGDAVDKFGINLGVKRHENRFYLGSHKGTYDPFLATGDMRVDFNNMAPTRGRLPGWILLPLLLAMIIELLKLKKREGFLTAFYTFSSGFFVILLLLPLLNSIFAIYGDLNHERRILAEKPEFKLGDSAHFTESFEKYFDDNFGFRGLLVSLGGKIKFYVFGSSVSPIAAVGKDGWLYLKPAFCHITNDAKEGVLFTPAWVQQMFAEWENNQRQLQQDGISYYRIFWPEKHTIYAERMPEHMQAIIHDTVFRLDQVLDYSRQKKSPIRLVDVEPMMMAAKKENQLFLRYDSHWNAFGAFVGYTALMNQLAADYPQLKPHPFSDYEVTYKELTGGDMADGMYVEEKEMVPVFTLKRDPSHICELSYYEYPVSSFVFENDKASSDLSIVIYRDSYTTEMIPFLKPHFKKIVFLWGQNLSYDYMRRLHPDIVLESRVAGAL